MCTVNHILTHLFCFFQDLALEYDIFAESFETSVAWDRTLSLCYNVKHRLKRECEGSYDYFLVTELTFVTFLMPVQRMWFVW